jgi:hypothetical protein
MYLRSPTPLIQENVLEQNDDLMTGAPDRGERQETPEVFIVCKPQRAFWKDPLSLLSLGHSVYIPYTMPVKLLGADPPGSLAAAFGRSL